MTSLVRGIKAEGIKGRHTSARKLALMAPLACITFAVVLTIMTSAYVQSAWNWWYTMFLPGMICLVSASVASIDSKQNLRPLLGIAIPLESVWLSKIIYCSILLFAANLAVGLGTSIVSLVGGLSLDLLSVGGAVVLLTICNAWMIPLSLFLSTRFSALIGFLIPFLTQVVVGFGMWMTSLWWLFPPSSSLCLMTPVLGILPNGIVAPAEYGLACSGYHALVSIVIAGALFVGLCLVTTKWFSRQEAK